MYFSNLPCDLSLSLNTCLHHLHRGRPSPITGLAIRHKNRNPSAKTPTPSLSLLLPTIDPQLKHQPLIPPPSLSFNTTSDNAFPQENTSFFITFN
jgi:hypothetical protein